MEVVQLVRVLLLDEEKSLGLLGLVQLLLAWADLVCLRGTYHLRRRRRLWQICLL